MMHKTMMHKTPNFFAALRRALVLGAALALTGYVTGCGGSTNATGSSTLNGLLLDADRAPLSGYRVVYDKGATALTTTTDGQGRYRLVVPRDAITGRDTLTFSDAGGHLVDLVSVTIYTNVPSTSLTTVAPPEPPTQTL